MEDILLRTELALNATSDEVREVVDGALQRETELARGRRDHFARLCHELEQKHGLGSDEFLKQFESGALGDDADYFDWYAAKRGLDLWERRFSILSGVHV